MADQLPTIPMAPTREDLIEARTSVWERMRDMLDTAWEEGRHLTASEQLTWDQLHVEMSCLDHNIAKGLWVRPEEAANG